MIHTIIKYLLISATLFFCSCHKPKTDIITPAKQLIERQIGERAQSIHFEYIEPSDGKDIFEVIASDGRLTLRGSSSVAICYAFHTYMKEACKSMKTWSGEHITSVMPWPDYELYECGKWFLTTNARHTKYCGGYAPGDKLHRTCRQIGNLKGREQRELADDHPLKQIYEKRLNTINRYVKRGTLDADLAEVMKKLAKDKMLRAVSNVAYAKGDYEKEMEQAALKKEAKIIKQTYIGGM